MKIFISTLNNRVVRYSLFGYMTQNDELQYEIESDMDLDKILLCDYINGKLYYNEGYILLDKQNLIREHREKHCFSVVNRGQVWYNALSTEELVELQIWYQAWLDAPQTLIEPEKPIWIK